MLRIFFFWGGPRIWVIFVIFGGNLKRKYIQLSLGGVFYIFGLDPVVWWWCWVIHFLDNFLNSSINYWDTGIEGSSIILDLYVSPFSFISFCFTYFTVSCRSLEKAMVPHSSTLAWKIPWTEEPGRLQSMGSLIVGHDWVTSPSCTGEGNGNPLQCSCLENPRDREAWWADVYGVSQSWTQLKQLSSSSRSFVLGGSLLDFLLLLTHPVMSNTLLLQASLSLTISRSFSKFMFITLVMLSSHLIFWCPFLLLPSIFQSIRDFSNESFVCIRWSKYWSFSFSISPYSERSGLIVLRLVWFSC